MLGFARSIHVQGVVAAGEGDYEQAKTLLEQGKSIREQQGDDVALQSSLHNLGLIALGSATTKRPDDSSRDRVGAWRRRRGAIMQILQEESRLRTARGHAGKLTEACSRDRIRILLESGERPPLVEYDELALEPCWKDYQRRGTDQGRTRSRCDSRNFLRCRGAAQAPWGELDDAETRLMLDSARGLRGRDRVTFLRECLLSTELSHAFIHNCDSNRFLGVRLLGDRAVTFRGFIHAASTLTFCRQEL